MTTDLKVYEVAFLAKSLEEDKALTDLIKQYRGNVLRKNAFQEVKLAYPIKKQTSAYFGCLQFEFLPQDIDKLSEALKLQPAILRHLIVTPLMVTKVVRKAAERKSETPEIVRPVPASKATVLTNEALEERLEEILK